ncbi:MAG: HAD hydrolase family protein [Chlamydiia bacterium]|nr:HAD hydrolase family protein [Chlamydiia bacterium]
MKKEKYLFLCDLDGTLLNNSSESTISDIDKEAISRLRAEGHIFAIATGRP